MKFAFLATVVFYIAVFCVHNLKPKCEVLSWTDFLDCCGFLIDNNWSAKKKITSVAIVFVICWCIINYWFFINVFVLKEYLGYGFFDSIKFSSQMTGQYTTFLFYIKEYFNYIIASTNGNFFNEIAEAFRPLAQQMDDISSTQTILNILSF